MLSGRIIILINLIYLLMLNTEYEYINFEKYNVCIVRIVDHYEFKKHKQNAAVFQYGK